MKRKVSIKEIIESGSEITGNISAAVIGGLAAGPAGIIIGGVTGPIISKIFKSIGNEVQDRFLSPRENIRICAAYTYALNKLKEYIDNGFELRTDNFFEEQITNRSSAEELLEGIILSAQREHEERKIQFIGNLYASICIEPGIDLETANQYINTANNLSYRQYCLLRILDLKEAKKNSAQKNDLQENNSKKPPSIIRNSPVNIELRDLSQKGLVRLTSRMHDTLDNSAPSYDIKISFYGSDFCHLVALKDIDQDDVDTLNNEIKLLD